MEHSFGNRIGEELSLGQITHVGSSFCRGVVLPSTTVANTDANPVSRDPVTQMPADPVDKISSKIHITHHNGDEKPGSDTSEREFERMGSANWSDDTEKAEQRSIAETLADLLIKRCPEFSHIRKSERLHSLQPMSWQRKPEQPRITCTPNPSAPPPTDDEDSSEIHDHRQSPSFCNFDY